MTRRAAFPPTNFGPGMSLRDYFAAAAISNPVLCSGEAHEYDLKAWFGRDASEITRSQIAAKQAFNIADKMIKESDNEK